MKIINKCLSEGEFRKYISRKKISRRIDKIILHHTEDTLAKWEKKKVSVGYYKRLYEKKGWKTGPHLFIAPEGIYLFTDMSVQGIHANGGNEKSIGIEIVGNYDKNYPRGKVWSATKSVLKNLLYRFCLRLEDIHFHREYNRKKTCPGRTITKKWLRGQLLAETRRLS